MNDYEKSVSRIIASGNKKIINAYNTCINKILSMFTEEELSAPNFRLADHIDKRGAISDAFKELQKGIVKSVKVSSMTSWNIADQKNDDLCKALGYDNVNKYMVRNPAAREAFVTRQRNGLGLSDRVWKYTDQFKEEIEVSVRDGIERGISASEMSRHVRQYLNEPNRLFRRVRGKDGKLHLSKAAQEYHPGRGVYRSSYKNAMRMCRTETNMAYRAADHDRWQTLDFVVGQEVRLSNNHPEEDICNDLHGKYPKDFKFTGWHPQCRCFVVPILKSDKEMEQDMLLIGEAREDEIQCRSIHFKDDVPKGFKNWLNDNQERIEKSSTLPYFLRDNGQMKDGKYILNTFAKNATKTATKPLSLLERAKVRQAARTPEQVEDIKGRWEERKRAINITKGRAARVLEIAKDYPEVDFSAMEQAIASGNVTRMEEATKELLPRIKEMREHERALGDLIPDVHQWHKKFSIQELQDTYDATKATMAKFAHHDLDGQLKNLKYESVFLANNTKDVQSRRKTWQVAKSVYDNQIHVVEEKIWWRDFTDKADILKNFSTKDKVYKKYLDALETATVSKDKNKAQEMLLKLETKRAKLEAKLPKTPANPLSQTLYDLKAQYGSNLPKTLENLDLAIREYEKTSKYGVRAQKHKHEIEQTMKELFAKHDLGMNVNSKNLDKILNSYFKNQFETGSSGGWSEPVYDSAGLIPETHNRLIAAHKLFGIHKNVDVYKNQLHRQQYEKYGNLLSHDIKDALKHNVGAQYGKVQVRFKKDKVTCTWTAGDSLGGRYQPSLVSDPKACSYDGRSNVPYGVVDTDNLTQFRRLHAGDYIELQFHGDVTIDCVESLAYPYNLLNPSEILQLEVAKKWKKIGVKVYYLDDFDNLVQL